MVSRWHLTAVAVCMLLVTASIHADIYRWDTGEVIPGTEGTEPGPGVDLSQWRTDDHNLYYGDFSGGLNLESADFRLSWLNNADFSNANLTDALFSGATLAEANLTGAIVSQATFYLTTARGLTKEQLYSTASYQQQDLRGIRLGSNDLTGWSFKGQDLSNAVFNGAAPSNMTDADFSKANMTGVDARGTDLTRANLSEANLTYANLDRANLTDADLSGANLTGAILTATLDSTIFTDAVIAGATLSPHPPGPTSLHGFTEEMLYSTASYKAKDLREIRVTEGSWLTGWDLSGQDLTNARLGSSHLANAVLSNANLTSADISPSPLTNTDLTGANLKNTNLRHTSPDFGILDSTTVYNQWTAFDDDFDPIDAGLTFAPSPVGDFDADGIVGVGDVDMLTLKIRNLWKWSWLGVMFDLDSDSHVNQQDRNVWIEEVMHTWYGDANLDGGFDSGDMVQVSSVGKYERGWLDEWGRVLGEGAGWAEGDWNGDGVFDSSDMVTAFVDGGYEKGPRTDAVAVPEPGGWLLLAVGLSPLLFGGRRRRPV